MSVQDLNIIHFNWLKPLDKYFEAKITLRGLGRGDIVTQTAFISYTKLAKFLKSEGEAMAFVLVQAGKMTVELAFEAAAASAAAFSAAAAEFVAAISVAALAAAC